MDCTLHMVGWIAFGIAAFLVVGFLLKILWNWLMPNISSLKRVTYLQALGLLIIARLLFGGFGHMGGKCFGDRHCSSGNYSNCGPGKWDGRADHCGAGKEMEKAPEGK